MLEYNGKASIRMSEYKVDGVNTSHSLRVKFHCHLLGPLFDYLTRLSHTNKRCSLCGQALSITKNNRLLDLRDFAAIFAT